MHMKQIIFLRHAETKMNKEGRFCGRRDVEISEEGRKQAEKMRETFKEYHFDAMYCSPLKRTKQTLEAIFPNQKFIKEDGFTEISLGDWEGKNKETVDQSLRKDFQKGINTPPHGEKHEDVEARVKETIERIFATYPDDSLILVCTSNGIMRTIKRMYHIKTENIMLKNLEYFTLEIPK